MSQKPTIAVVIPTMNRKEMMRESLRSVLAQTRQPDEIFISDNSKEPDATLLEEFPGAPIRYHWHDRKLHIEEHWKWALRQPKTDYVAWLEDDNLFLEDHLAQFEAAVLKYPEASLIGSVGLVFTDLHSSWRRTTFASHWPCDLLTGEPVVIPRDTAMASFFYASPIASSAVMVKRSLMDIEGAFVDCGCWMPLDRWLWAEFAALGDTIFIPKITLLYRIHGSNHTNTIKRKMHIVEGRKVTELVLDKMRQKGIEPTTALKGLATFIRDDVERRRNGLSLLQFRNWPWIKKYMPATLGKSTFGECIPVIISIIIRQLLTKLLPSRN